MIIKNEDIAGFGKFLLKFELKGEQSRMRTRLVKQLQEKLDSISQEKQDLIQDYAKKDENGEIVKEINEETNEEFIPLTDGKEYYFELHKLMTEDFVLEETPNTIKVLEFVKDLVLNCDWTFSGEEAMEYDKWCEIVEGWNHLLAWKVVIRVDVYSIFRTLNTNKSKWRVFINEIDSNYRPKKQ